ncbi:hypothetical protein MMC12_003831 [Toensbergia leucococca]|nr:hypothetical protein [Toensbergia leucococca]
MPPTRKPQKMEQRVNTILAFATGLEESLRSHDTLPSTTKELYRFIDDLPLSNDAAVVCRARDLDSHGTRLWNLAVKLNKADSTDAELVCLVRVFACLLLDYAQRWTKRSAQNDSRVLESALKTIKNCLDRGHLSLAERAVERAAFYEERLTFTEGHILQDDTTPKGPLSKEYYVLRIALGWRQKRLDLAEIMLTKLGPRYSEFDPALAENLADLLLEIGKDQMEKLLYSDAITWLEKAYDILLGQTIEALSSNAKDLQISVMHRMVKALMGLRGEDSRAKAWNIVRNMETESGDKLAVLLLRLDLYTVDSTSSPQDFCDTLQKIVRTVHLTDSNLKTALHHVHNLRHRSPAMAHTVLASLLTERLVDAGEPKWLERVLVTTIWNITTSPDPVNELGLLGELLDTLGNKFNKVINPSATHAIQILFWKRVEASYHLQDYVGAEGWAGMALHVMFRNSGELNRGKLQRKLILCALARSDLSKAQDVCAQMSESNKCAPSTQYLIYRIALKCKDTELASDCLNSICNTSRDITLLYACVLEAQQSGDCGQTVAAMQRVIDRYDSGKPDGVHLPALLRCTARLLIERSSAHPQQNHSVNEICVLFEAAAAAQAKTATRGTTSHLFSQAELDWFSRNSYNLALRFCTSWSPSQTLRLLQACLKVGFIDLYPPDMNANLRADLSLRRLFCDYLSCSLFVVLARSDVGVEDQLRYYLGLRKVAEDFRGRLQEQLKRLEGGAKKDLLRKHTSLVAFDFEAAVRLKAWEDLFQLIEECQACNDPKIFYMLADVIMCSEAPSETIIVTLQHIFNMTWRLDTSDIEKLSRWIRCLFSLALVSKIEMAEHLLDQVLVVAVDARTKPQSYPLEELEWLATTAFNQGVDFYCASQDSACRRWTEKALSIASLSNDGGALHQLLQTKYLGLKWDH